MTKKNIMPVVVLTAICVIVAALLALVNMITAPEIELRAKEEIRKSLAEVLPEAEDFEPVSIEGAPKTVSDAYLSTNGVGCVVIVKTTSSYTKGEDMTLSIGIDAGGKIKGIKVTAYSESKDVGADYPNGYVGLGASDINVGDNKLLVSGVTYSSKAFKAAVADALEFSVSLIGGPSAESIAENMLLGKITEMEIPEGASVGIEAIYSGAIGYAAVVRTSSKYVPTTAYAVVGVDFAGKIIGFEMLEWNHGEGIEYTDDFTGSFVGCGESDIEGLAGISGATGNVSAIKAIVREALEIIDGMIEEKLLSYLPEGKTLERVTVAGAPETVLVSYTFDGGIIAVTKTSTQYVAYETLGIVVLDSEGKISDTEMLVWQHGEGLSYTDEFLGSFVGRGESDIDGVPNVSGATGTAGNFKAAVASVIDFYKLVKGGV